MSLTSTAVALTVLNKLNKKSIKRAEEKVREKGVVINKFYLFIQEGARPHLYDPHFLRQDFMAKLLRIKSLIEAYSGKNIIQNTTMEGTMIFFDMPESGARPLEMELQKYSQGISLGRATKS